MKKINILHIFILGLVLRMAWLCYSLPVPASDYLAYLDHAKAIHDRLPYPSKYWLPGWPALLSLFLFNNNVAWLQFISVLLHSANIFLVYFLAKKLWPGKELVSAFLFSIYPQFVMFSAILNSEGLALMMFLVALSVSVKLKNWIGSGVSGIAMAVFSLTRGEGIFYIPLVALMYHKKRLIPFLVPIMVLCGVWFLRNGGTLSTTGGVNLYYGHNPKIYGYHPLLGVDKNSVKIDREYRNRAIRYVLENPLSLAQSVWTGAKRLYTPSDYALQVSARVDTEKGKTYRKYPGQKFLVFISKFSWLILAGFGIAGLIKNRDRLIFSVILINFICYCVIFFGVARYRYVPEVFLCFAAAFIIQENNK